MDKTIKKRNPDTGRPVVVYANWYQFGPGEVATRPRVQSRMLLWCVSGAGEIRVNGNTLDFPPRTWTLLPWEHEIRYKADADHPFFVGGVHILPWQSDAAAIEFHVAHARTDDLADHPARRNHPWPGLDQLLLGHFSGEIDRLALLASYTVEKFQHSHLLRETANTLAELLIEEIRLAAGGHSPPSPGKPAPLLRMQQYVRVHLDRQVTVEDLAGIAECSPASVHRLFRTFEGEAPGHWIAKVRAGRAAFLLRTTRMPIHEIGVQLGLNDPFHFSRFFKKEMGQSPRDYRQSRGFF